MDGGEDVSVLDATEQSLRFGISVWSSFEMLHCMLSHG